LYCDLPVSGSTIASCGTVAIRTGRVQLRPPFTERLAKISVGAVTGWTGASPKTSSKLPSASSPRRDSKTASPDGEL
jgi:hypothetical protein